MKLKDLEEYLEEIEVQSYELFKEQEQEYRLWLEQRFIYISEYGINIREGIYEAWNMESQNYEAEHSFYMIFSRDRRNYLYSETGSSMVVSLYNFLVLNNCCMLSYNQILDLECEL